MTPLIFGGGNGTRLNKGPKYAVEICGKPFYQWIVEAVAPHADSEIVMVTPVGTPKIKGIRQIEGGRGHIRDIFDSVEILRSEGKLEDGILGFNVDAVMITREDVGAFLGMCYGEDNFIWPAIRRESIPQERRSWRVTNYLPGTRCDYARGMMMLFRGNVHPSPVLLEAINRSKISSYLATLGWKLPAKIFTLRSQLSDLEERIGLALDCKAKLPECGLWRAALDVDDEVGYHYAETALKAR